MIRIALTGPSGAGKGYVGKLLAEKGLAVLDTDRLVHALYAGGALPLQIAALFGNEVLAPDGSVARKRLAEIVFSDREALGRLNGVVHAAVKQEVFLWLADREREGYRAAVVDAPQLFEAGMEKDFDSVIVVTAPLACRIERICARDGIERERALERIQNQMSAEDYSRRADYVIVNDGVTDPRKRIDTVINQIFQYKEDPEMDAKELKSTLLYQRKTAMEAMTEEQKAGAEAYAVDYMQFLDLAKTEREAVTEGIRRAEAAGFVPYSFGDKIEVGGKYYMNNRGKALYMFRIGTENVENGIRISAAHVDSPRLDLKPNPLFEEGGFGYLKTHYYGGVKKYQWTAIPLALHGVVIKQNGEKVEIVIGEDDSDPIFYISDLLPHLAKDQMSKTLRDAIPGEKLNIMIGSTPYDATPDGTVKLHMMQLINEKYGIVESDFQSAEISVVPAFKSRFVGFDRSMIAGYGHDDRVCAHPAIRAIVDSDDSVHTCMAILADKEEVGSGGNTGMKSGIFMDIIEEISKALGANNNAVKHNSKCLSADVHAAYDPAFAEVYEKNNTCVLGGGVVLTKYTGSGGKGGTNDASAELIAFVRKSFEGENVLWQTGELGKVDQGGGGTVAVYISEKNIDVVDLGVPVLSMHAPYECISKYDLYMTYLAFKSFNLN